MGLREDLVRKIEKKQAELADAERQWDRQKAAAEAYVQALQETLKVLPRDAGGVKPENILRAGGALARVRELILSTRKPQHVNDILRALGKGVDKKARASITSALGAYVRRQEVFLRTAPNTFGLIELGHSQSAEEEPPADFGKVRSANLVPPQEEKQEDGVNAADDDEVPL